MRTHLPTQFFGIALSLLLTACGGGGSDSGSGQGGNNAASSESTTGNGSIAMVLNKPYEMSEGDTIKKQGPDSTIRIERDTRSNTTYSTLLTGQANLTRTAQ